MSICLIVTSVDSQSQQQEMPPAQVKIALAEERKIAPTMDVSGSVISIHDAEISTQVDGEIQWMARVGDKVKAGDIIAKIDPEVFDINLRRAKALLGRLNSDLKFREQEVSRFNTLALRDSASKAQLQQELARRDMLLHDIEDAKAQVALAQKNLSNTNIKAPFDGHLTKRMADVGEYLSMGETVFQLVDTQALEVSLYAPMSVVRFLSIDSEVSVAMAEQSYRLPVRALVPVGDPVSRMIEVRLTVNEQGWITGAPVTVSLPKEKSENTIAIPRDALIVKGSNVFLYRVNDELRAEQLTAKVDKIDGQWVSLHNSIKQGDKVIVRGAERIQPGQSVIILD